MCILAAAPALTYLTLATATMAAYSQYQAGQGAKKVAEYNAASARRAEADALVVGQQEEARYRRGIAEFKGRQRAAAAAGGAVVDQDSPLRAVEDTAVIGELDALTIRNNAARVAWGYAAQALGYRFQGKVAARTGTLQAAGSLLGGYTSLASYGLSQR